MGGRYLVSGAQLGMLKAFIQVGTLETKQEHERLIDEIIDKQYIGSSNLDVVKDVENMVKVVQIVNKEIAV